MPDDHQSKQDASTATSSTQTSKGKSSAIKADPKKTNEQYVAEAEKLYIIPKLVRDVFPDLIKLIFETESMDEDEREYWLQILPIMTEDQIKKFKEILVNEKDQLTKLDNEYSSEMSKLNAKQKTAFNEEEIKKRREELRSKESAAENEDAQKEQELLNQLKNL
jgi:hypothetical protein